MTPRLQTELLALGIDLQNLRPAYPSEACSRGVRLAAAQLFPRVGEVEAVQQLGELFLDGYGETLVGRALIQLMKVIGPMRSLQRMQRNFRTGSNYIETRFTELAPTKAEIWLNDTSGIPSFWAGVMTSGGRLTNAESIRVRFTSGADGSATYVIEWQAT